MLSPKIRATCPQPGMSLPPPSTWKTGIANSSVFPQCQLSFGSSGVIPKEKSRICAPTLAVKGATDGYPVELGCRSQRSYSDSREKTPEPSPKGNSAQ